MACLPYLTKKISGNDISITVSESDDWYKLTADYPEEKTRKSASCMDEYLEPSGMSFVDARIDGDIWRWTTKPISTSIPLREYVPFDLYSFAEIIL